MSASRQLLERRRQALLERLPDAGSSPLKSLTLLVSRLAGTEFGGFDRSTYARDVRILVERGYAEVGILRRTPDGDAKSR